MPPPLDLLPELLKGLAVTLEVFLGAAACATGVALVMGLARRAPMLPVRWTATGYVEVFRGTSALVQLFWFYYVLPRFGITLPPMAVGILVLGLNYGAYGAEIVRGAVAAVPRSQVEAGIALNLAPVQRLRRIVLPQAFPRMLPPAGNLLIEMLKNSALVSFIGVPDLTWSGKVLQAPYPQRTAEIFGMILILYFGLSALVALGMRRLERRVAR